MAIRAFVRLGPLRLVRTRRFLLGLQHMYASSCRAAVEPSGSCANAVTVPHPSRAPDDACRPARPFRRNVDDLRCILAMVSGLAIVRPVRPSSHSTPPLPKSRTTCGQGRPARSPRICRPIRGQAGLHLAVLVRPWPIGHRPCRATTET